MKKNKKTVSNLNQNFSGYTLIEVTLVMAFVSLSFMALYGIFTKTIQGDTESRNEIIASNLAQECIERVRNCRDEEVLNDPFSWDILSLNSCSGEGAVSITSGGQTFTAGASISGDDLNYKIVTCTTTWTSSLGNNLQREVKIKSLLSNWQKEDELYAEETPTPTP